MIIYKYGVKMPPVSQPTEFCAVVAAGSDGTAEEWFLVDEDDDFVQELGKVLKGRPLLSLFREVEIEIKG